MCDKIAPQTGGFRGDTRFYMAFPYLFHRRSTEKPKENDDVLKTFRTLIDARFDRLESNFQLLRREWADANEKLMLLYDRSRKRLKAIEEAEGAKKTIEATPEPVLSRQDILKAYIRQNGG